jgi:predicted NUDIX family phosphoesterase
MTPYEDENVLVVPRDLFDELGSFQGLSSDVGTYLPAFLDPANNFFLPREAAENDPSRKQIIPYAIFRYGDRFLRYVRGKKSGEQRLANKASIGIGGHINQHDAAQASLERNTYMTGVDREIMEELIITGNYTQQVTALINDDSNPVGQVHLGVVHLFDLETDAVSPGEANIQDLAFLRREQLIEERERLETWSQICIDNLDSILPRPPAGAH